MIDVGICLLVVVFSASIILFVYFLALPSRPTSFHNWIFILVYIYRQEYIRERGRVSYSTIIPCCSCMKLFDLWTTIFISVVCRSLLLRFPFSANCDIIYTTLMNIVIQRSKSFHTAVTGDYSGVGYFPSLLRTLDTGDILGPECGEL